MQIIPIRTHALIDYVVAVLLALAPFILGFADGGPAMWTPIAIGILIAGSSLLTRHPLSLWPAITMPAHLWIDIVASAFLALSPWILGFAHVVWWPHVVIGAAGIVIAIFSERRSFNGYASPEVEPRGP